MIPHYSEMIHPATVIDKRERDRFAAWRNYWIRRGVVPGCYGVYQYCSITRKQRAAAACLNVQAKGAATVRKRPANCSHRLWRNWKSYRGLYGPISLYDYADRKRRLAWRRTRALAPMTPREMAEALLKRKGLAP